MTKVLFVCLGNVCRSAMADAIFRRLVKEAGVQDQYQIDSAGTSDEEQGHLPNPHVRKILTEHGYDYHYLHARQITPQDYRWADYIIGMDTQNVADLKANAPKGCQSKIHLCLNILPNHQGQEIPDPWFTHRFNYTYQVLTKVLPVWLRYFQSHTQK
ncbi:MAG: low molecular weight phosphotyrosine protein phosphatase [Acetilactobacillus jinshanensis]